MSTDHDVFSTETAGLAQVSGPQVIPLAHGDRFALSIGPVRKDLDDTGSETELRMLAYNGSIPGPTLRVPQGAEITVDVRNDGDVETTVHWHGLRLENRFDGVPHETQEPIPVGGGYSCRVQFPDAGFYWYHPHLREDFAQEMGLYGTIVVDPTDPGYWPAVDRELTLTLDDLLVEDGHIAAFSRSGPNFTAMGRFGNVLLINGETTFAGTATAGEVVRLYLVNTANTRLFNFALRGARMKLVGGDSGRYERESFIEDVLLAPSERAVVDVLFDAPGQVRLEHRTPHRTYDLGTFAVAPATNGGSAAAGSYGRLRIDQGLTAERRIIDHDLGRKPDKVLAFVSKMPLLYGEDLAPASSFVCPMHPEVTDTAASTCPNCGMKLVPAQGAPVAVSFVCPMHPEVTDTAASTCPNCGMKLVPAQGAPVAVSFVCPMHPDVTATEPSTCPQCGMKLVPSDAVPAASHAPGESHAHGGGDGLEWEDLMPDINRASDPGNMIWQLVDRETGAVNHAIEWAFTVGDRVKIRLVNEMDQDHPMHHPWHVHGAGRFLVLSRDGVPEPNLVWKDTVLLRAGQTVDVLLDVSNPGLWMAHCHIAEHTESGMMFSFNVARRPEPVR
jgi:FtsP/CotA-like multicopper oxidase with cupredoxin domain